VCRALSFGYVHVIQKGWMRCERKYCRWLGLFGCLDASAPQLGVTVRGPHQTQGTLCGHGYVAGVCCAFVHRVLMCIKRKALSLDWACCRHVCCALYISRVGQNRIYAPYMTVCMVISLPKIPYMHRIYMVLANLTYTVGVCLRFWLTLLQHYCSAP
jgi:hypothetical protein